MVLWVLKPIFLALIKGNKFDKKNPQKKCVNSNWESEKEEPVHLFHFPVPVQQNVSTLGDHKLGKSVKSFYQKNILNI